MPHPPVMVALNRAALAVIEEIRQERWTEKPSFVKCGNTDWDGMCVVPISEEVYEQIKKVSRPDESPSALIVRAYREGKFSQPLSSQ